MAKVNQLKNQARREEQRENWSRAIELYTQALDASRKESQGFADLSLYNRIGDIYLRIGQKNTAVRYYEQAIELYAEQDLHTSAIALCNKVLRILPDRSTVFLQLGRLNLATNLVAEGREHYHRYATAMRRRGSEEAALEGLEELIASTGDAGTLTLWAGWLAESSDTDAAVARIERVRESLERHGIDPDEVAAQVRSKTVVGFEGTGREATTADPLAGAFLTLGEDAPSSARAAAEAPTPEPPHPEEAAARGEDKADAEVLSIDDEGEAARASETREPELAPSGDDTADTPEPEFVAWEADTAEPSDADEPVRAGAAPYPTGEPDDAVDEPPAPVEPGSIPWEQEVEEIIAEFDLAVEGSWTDLPPEPGDLAAEAGGRVRSRPDPEASEAATATWAQAPARRPQTVEAAEFDELEAAVPKASRAGAIDVEDAEEAGSSNEEDAAAGVDRLECEAVEAPDPGLDTPVLEVVDGESPEPVDGRPAEQESAGATEEEPAETPAGALGEGLEPVFAVGTDELESIVQAAAALSESGGFDAEPAVVADELPEPDPEEPSEADAELAPQPETAPPVASLEPSDLDAAEPRQEAPFESLESLVESISSRDGMASSEPTSLSMESDEAGAADDAGWADEARRTLDERARNANEAEGEPPAKESPAADSTAPASTEPPEPTGIPEAVGEADVEAETIAVEWTSAELDGGGPEPESDSAHEPDQSRRGSEPESVAEAPTATGAGHASGEPTGPARATPSPANRRPGRRSRAGGAADEEEPRAPLAEPRLTVEEDPEDAFRDWVESASTGVLKRALAELENRKEHERALAVLRRLGELEPTVVEFRARHVEYLERLGRTREAVDGSLALAAMLEAAGRPTEAREAYERTLRLAPGEQRALEGLGRLEGVEVETQEEAVQGAGPKRPYMPDHVNGTDHRSVIDRPKSSVSLQPGGPGHSPRPYSGVAGGSEAGTDFEQLLSEFRAELHEKPSRNDSSTRTELGARLKEMGRLDDAIRELQAAVREPSAPPLAFELLGEAFLEKGQPRIAVRFLEKALGGLSQGDRDILGVLYQLGIAYEALSDVSKALICYERIFSVDIDYRDIQERILRCSA